MNFVNCRPPSADTLEISLFGTGVGEGLAVHLGNGDWALVDTCREIPNSTPLNLAYLESIGVDVAVAVKIIIATHWHDDHVDGLSNIIARCPNARLAFSQALACDEFLSLVQLYGDPDYILDREKSGVKEMVNALRILKDRKKLDPNSYRPPITTQADHLLFRNDHCDFYAISPSPEAIQEAAEEMARMWHDLENESSVLGGPRPSRASVASPDRNLNAVALWIRWGDKRMMLGSDLEEYGSPHLGWQAALSCQRFPDRKATIFKIPHHGSPNGDHGDVWDKIVEPDNPITILSAYARGVTPRPSMDDIARIKRRTNQFYYTTLPRKTVEKYSSVVEKTIAGVAKRRQSLRKNPGQIQIRWEANGEIQIQLSGSAGTI